MNNVAMLAAIQEQMSSWKPNHTIFVYKGGVDRGDI